MEGSSGMDRVTSTVLQRLSSIENEPRTLNNDEIEFAREAALHVVNTSSIQEASRVFTEGLQAVVHCASNNEDIIMEWDGDFKCYNNILQIPVPAPKDISTAPF